MKLWEGGGGGYTGEQVKETRLMEMKSKVKDKSGKYKGMINVRRKERRDDENIKIEIIKCTRDWFFLHIFFLSQWMGSHRYIFFNDIVFFFNIVLS